MAVNKNKELIKFEKADSIFDTLKYITDGNIPDSESNLIDLLNNTEMPEDKINIMSAMLAGTARKGMSGDLKSLEWIIDTLGLNQPDKYDGKVSGYSGIPGYLLGKAYVDIYRDIIERRHRYYDFKGGRGSLKSTFCALVMIDEIMRNPNFCGIALRQVKDTLTDSVYAQLIWAIDKLGFTQYFRYTKTSPMQIEKIDTGQIIYFKGCDEPTKIKSIKPPGDMYVGVIWFEEKDQLKGPEAVRNIQQSVMRGGDDIIVLSSYNTPISRKHFLNREEIEVGGAAWKPRPTEKELPPSTSLTPPSKREAKGTESPGVATPPPFAKGGMGLGTESPLSLRRHPPFSKGGMGKDVKEIGNRIVHHSFYYDSPPEWLGQPFLDEAEYLKETDEKAYRHEYLGEAVGEGGSVFENVFVKNFETEEYKKIRETDRLCFGVDWGFCIDPWAYVKCCYIAKERRLYIIDEARAYRKINQVTADILLNEKKLTKDDMLICDSSEPKSISDYMSYGLYARGAEKGPGSIGYSMKWLQGLNGIVIDRQNCPNTAREFLEYEYEKDANGEIISGYPDKNNHFIDAVRYATNLLWRKIGGE